MESSTTKFERTPRVAVLTTFMDLPSGYGLVPVVLNQLQLLVKQRFKVGLFVMQGFEKHADAKKLPAGVLIEPFVPFLHLFHYFPGTKKQTFDVEPKGVYVAGKPFAPKTNFDKQVDLIEETLEAELTKYDVVITHDIVFQVGFVVVNQAIRNIAKRHPKIRWIHWLHSGPAERPAELTYPHNLRFSPMENSIWVSPNDSMIPKFAEMYNVPRKRIRVIYHTFDPCRFFGMSPFSKQLIAKHDLLKKDVLCVWATRIDHPEGKGLKYAVWLMAQINKIAEGALLFLNSHSNSPKAKETIVALRKEAETWGLPPENLIFSSEMGSNWETGVPPEVVRDMLWIANLFILPSTSETFSLATMEAAACKNLLVLNENLTVMKELAGDNAIYMPFPTEWGGTITKVDYNPNAESYFMDQAELIVKVLKGKVFSQQRYVLRHFSEDWVWKNQLEPLITGE